MRARQVKALSSFDLSSMGCDRRMFAEQVESWAPAAAIFFYGPKNFWSKERETSV